MKRVWLVDARRKVGFTQADLAAAIGKPQNYISRLESGVIPNPGIDEVVALARALNIDPMRIQFGKRVGPGVAA